MMITKSQVYVFLLCIYSIGIPFRFSLKLSIITGCNFNLRLNVRVGDDGSLVGLLIKWLTVSNKGVLAFGNHASFRRRISSHGTEKTALLNPPFFQHVLSFAPHPSASFALHINRNIFVQIFSQKIVIFGGILHY